MRSGGSCSPPKRDEVAPFDLARQSNVAQPPPQRLESNYPERHLFPCSGHSPVSLWLSSVCDDPILVASGDGHADLCVGPFWCATCDRSVSTRSPFSRCRP